MVKLKPHVQAWKSAIGQFPIAEFIQMRASSHWAQVLSEAWKFASETIFV